MATPPNAPDVLHKGDEVICARDLREVPEGTEGKVVLVVGLSWIRYWVRFANGVAVGSVNRRDLATPAEWAWRQEHGDEVVLEADDDDEDDAGGGDADGGGGYTRAGILVPQVLIDRSKAARERLGA